MIVDCCYAAKAFAREHIGKRKFELLASVGADAKAPTPSTLSSFTRSLIVVMRKLLISNPQGFRTSDLYRELYHTTDYNTKPMLFDQSRQDYGKIWLRPQVIPPNTPTVGKGDTFLNLTLRLNKEPGNVMMNELALALQYLPHVDQVRFETLYAPRSQIENFMSLVVQTQKLRPLVRKLHAKMKLKKLKAMIQSKDVVEHCSSYLQLFLEQKNHPTYDWSSATTDDQSEMALPSRMRRKSSTWPSTEVKQQHETRSVSNRLFSIDYKVSMPGYNTRLSWMTPFALVDLDKVWHITMWLAGWYVLGSMSVYISE